MNITTAGRRANKIIIFLSLVCLTAIFVSCSQETQTLEESTFIYNPDLVDTLHSFPGINFQLAPPLNWVSLDSAGLDGFRRMMAGTDLSRKLYPINPLAAFSDSVYAGHMYIAQIEEEEASFSRIAEMYEELLSEHVKEHEMSRAKIEINQLEVFQFLVRTNEIVNYKFLIETSPGKRILLEYILGSSSYSQIAPAVESSISSIRALPIN